MTKEQAVRLSGLPEISLAEWIRTIINRPADFESYTQNQDHIASLEKWSSSHQPMPPLDSALLHQLHSAFRGHPNESSAWADALGVFPGPVPDEIANDLIDRNVAVIDLGHRVHSDAIMLRLIPLVDEALLSSVKLRYERPEYSLEAFVQWTEPHHTRDWLLRSFDHWHASSHEKHAVAQNWIRSRVRRHY